MPPPLQRRPPESRRPNSPLLYAPAHRSYVPTQREVAERDAHLDRQALAHMPAGMAAGQWVFSPKVLNTMLWRHFQGCRFEWTDDGKKKFATEIAGEAKATYDKAKVALAGSGALPAVSDKAALGAVAPSKEAHLAAIGAAIGAHPNLMPRFAVDIGLAVVPFLSTITAGLKLSGAVVGAVQNYRHANQLQAIELVVQEVPPVFDLARVSIVDCLGDRRRTQTVNIGLYIFDVVVSLVPVAAPIAAVRVGADLARSLKNLYRAWMATDSINTFLAGDGVGAGAGLAVPDMLGLIGRYPVLGCHLLSLHDQILTGHFSDLDVEEFTDDEQKHILKLLGVGDAVEVNHNRIVGAREIASRVIDDLPYKLKRPKELPLLDKARLR
jgi:hypothetical protein